MCLLPRVSYWPISTVAEANIYTHINTQQAHAWVFLCRCKHADACLMRGRQATAGNTNVKDIHFLLCLLIKQNVWLWAVKADQSLLQYCCIFFVFSILPEILFLSQENHQCLSMHARHVCSKMQRMQRKNENSTIYKSYKQLSYGRESVRCFLSFVYD